MKHTMKRIIFVVARNQVDLVPRLEQDRRGGNVEIIVDRRRADRREKSDRQTPGDRRRSERRIHSISSELDLIGMAVVVVS
jgi:hypothetical protein